MRKGLHMIVSVTHSHRISYHLTFTPSSVVYVTVNLLDQLALTRLLAVAHRSALLCGTPFIWRTPRGASNVPTKGQLISKLILDNFLPSFLSSKMIISRLEILVHLLKEFWLVWRKAVRIGAPPPRVA